ncbi:MAG: hypothetical protein WC553_01605 [Patescibacteria group bacterium]|jgi:hypothetical protein
MNHSSNPEGYLRRFETEKAPELPAEISFIELLSRETKEYGKPIEPQSFVAAGVYEQSAVDDDQQKLRKRIRELQESGEWKYSGERSQAITNLLFFLIGRKELLKPSDLAWDIVIGSVTRYDDVMRGTDLVITLCNYETGEEIPIAVDTTTSVNATVKKKKNIERDLEQGHLRRLKYYTSPVTDKPIGKQEMPAVVIGYEPDNFEIIAMEWSRHGDGAIKRLNLENSIRQEIVRQLTSQLLALDELTPEDSRPRLAEKLQRLIDLLAPVEEN